ncbi:MAG: hemerythrin domain-containing protein [Myxococcota bacterium]
MEGMLTGLRHRLDRALHRMEEQHRQLREIADRLDGAIAGGSPAEIERWLDRFGDALRSHFDLEEGVVFPAVHGLAESVRADLARLERDHAALLDGVYGLVTRASASDALVDALAALRRELRDHEKLEESVMAQVIETTDAER